LTSLTIEGPALRGLHAEQRQELRRDHLAFHSLAGAAAGEDEIGFAMGCHGGEAVVVALPVEEVGIGDRAIGEVRLVLVQRHQPVGLGEGQRLEQDTLDHREQRGVGAAAERQGEDGDRRRARRLCQHPPAKTQVLQ
jgi:hypothetical protein